MAENIEAAASQSDHEALKAEMADLKIRIQNNENDINGLGFRTMKLENDVHSVIAELFSALKNTLWNKIKSFSAKALTGVSRF